MNKDHANLVTLLSKELEERNLAVFIGAGFSRDAGIVDWKTLLKPIAEELELDVDKEWDLVTLAQYHVNANQGNRGKINQILVNEFTSNITPTKNHKILARLPLETYWTTNYDNLLEASLEEIGKVVDVKHTVKQLATNKSKRDAVIYKMHGDAKHPTDAILTRDDYERYHIKMQPFVTALSGDLVGKTFLFMGFSFTDPNIEHILSRVRIHYDSDQRQHHCILRRIKIHDNEEKADFEYKQRKEKLFAQELLRVGIKVTYVDEFSEITEILTAIENKYKRRTVFISGAAHSYAPWSQEESEEFIRDLSCKINKAKFRIISGFGQGVGSAVINGVLEQTVMNGHRLDSGQLLLFPFPQSQSGQVPLDETWRKYRGNMLDHAGIAIFLFGNKLADEGVVESSGMLDEFKMAREKGIFIIPIGITGYISKKIWQEVVDNFDTKIHPQGDSILSMLKTLGDKKTDLNQVKDIILRILNLI